MSKEPARDVGNIVHKRSRTAHRNPGISERETIADRPASPTGNFTTTTEAIGEAQSVVLMPPEIRIGIETFDVGSIEITRETRPGTTSARSSVTGETREGPATRS